MCVSRRNILRQKRRTGMKAFVWVAIVVVAISGIAQAQNDVALKVGVKVWDCVP